MEVDRGEDEGAAGHEQSQQQARSAESASGSKPRSMADHTIRTARLKMLYVAAKVTSHARRA